jgi:hypothetical protein
VKQAVVDVTSTSGLFEVTTSGGLVVRALSVIVATGMRQLSNEREFLGRGLFVTYMGYEYFPKLLHRVKEAGSDGVVIFGNAKSSNLGPLTADLAASCPGLTWVIDEPNDVPLPALPGRVLRGALRTILGNGDPNFDFDQDSLNDPSIPDFEKPSLSGVRGVEWCDEAGLLHQETCSSVLLDYNAWENRTRRDWDQLPIDGQPNGFISIDPLCQTSVEGVFAAGDITGRYRSTAMALGDGVNAGFSCIRYNHRKKFGYEPNLFAYMSVDRVLGQDERDIPPLHADSWLIPLVASTRLDSVARSHGLPDCAHRLLEGERIDTFTESVDASAPVVATLIEAWIEAKMIAIHAPVDSP